METATKRNQSMTDEETESERKRSKSKKRKTLKRAEEELPRSRKSRRVDSADEVKESAEVEESNTDLEEDGPWRNLKLILSLQNKDIDVQKKVTIALDFVKSREKEASDGTVQDDGTVKLSRVIVFLCDWIQSLLISSAKKVRVDREQPNVGVTCLNVRCWEIFKFCLKKSSTLQTNLSFSRNLLQPLQFIARHVLSELTTIHEEESFLAGEGYKLFSVVVDCVFSLFSSHDGMANESLELWISTVYSVLELGNSTFTKNLERRKAGVLALQFTCSILEPFAKFLRVHPTRKTGFGDFVHKLLEPLLQLVGHIHRVGNNTSHLSNLKRLVEEVLSLGVFHPTHTDGFLSLHSSDKYLTAFDGKSTDLKANILSYHRHLFEELEKIMTTNMLLALNGVGHLFHLLVERVKRLQGPSGSTESTNAFVDAGGTKQPEHDLSGHMSKVIPPKSVMLCDNDHSLVDLSAEARKSLFDFFVRLMEPFLTKLDNYLLDKMEVGDLLDIDCALKSTNGILSSFVNEKVYVRTEDISGGACFRFLKRVYDIMLSLSAKCNLFWLSKHDMNMEMHVGILSSVVMELVAAIGSLLEIEYEVIGEDLVSLWHMLLVHLATNLYLNDLHDRSLLTTKILGLGCQLVNLFSELRQVCNMIFSLCKAMRLLGTSEVNGEVNPHMFVSTSALSNESYVKSVGTCLCSREFRLAFNQAISSIPEGQASGCIQQLAEDISESLAWMTFSVSENDKNESDQWNSGSFGMAGFSLRCELLGRGLSEIYSGMLDSVNVTASNSVAVGTSLKNLIAVICPNLSSLVELPSGSLSEFHSYVIRSNFDKKSPENINSMEVYLSTDWVLVFFFRLYMSCRGLCRQAISLMPPASSKRMSALLGNSFTAYSGKDWMEKDDWTDEGYFSCIVKPSASLLTVIKSVSDCYLPSGVTDRYCLVYILHAMALQRLADLNRLIYSLEYALQHKKEMLQKQLLDGDDQSLLRKKCQKWEKITAKWRHEAQGLADFILAYLKFLVGDPSFSSYSDASTNNCPQPLHESNKWDFSVSCLNKESFPTAIWWIMCQSIDLWCVHSSDRKLKKFVLFLIRSSLPSIRENPVDSEGSSKRHNITLHQISAEILHDSTFHEHRFVHRHFASRLCHTLEKLAAAFFSGVSSVKLDLRSVPNWPQFLMELENSLSDVLGSKIKTNAMRPTAHLFTEQPGDDFGEITTCSRNMSYGVCSDLNYLLLWMPKEKFILRSFKCYVTHVINLERLAVGSLLDCQGATFSCERFLPLKLFLSCRKALKYLIEAYVHDNVEVDEHQRCDIILDKSFSMFWLWKSISMVSRLLDTWAEDSGRLNDLIFSLMDHTSHIFLMLSKCYFYYTLIESKRQYEEQAASDMNPAETNPVRLCSHMDVSRHTEVWESSAQSMKEEAQNLVGFLEHSFLDKKADVAVSSSEMRRLSCIVSCLSGFFGGLASAFNEVDGKDRTNKVLSSWWKHEPFSKLNLYIDMFADVVGFFLRIMLVQGKSDLSLDLLEMDGSSFSNSVAPRNMSSGSELKGIVTAFLESSDCINQSVNMTLGSHISHVEGDGFVASLSIEGNLFEQQFLNKSFLQQFPKGDHPEAAFLLRHLFIGYSAILKLNLKVDKVLLSLNVVHTFAAVSEFLILELVNGVELPQPFFWVCLDGVLKYLDVLGSYIPLTNPALSRNVFAKLIELHLVAIGKCIVLQGKNYTLLSHESASSTQMYRGHTRINDSTDFAHECCVDDFKARLRKSFAVYIKNAAELHMLSAVQAVERALVGVQERCMALYHITFGKVEGGSVSPFVAAGIDSLDLLLENVSGRKRLSVVRRHIQGFIACLFNIILHVQSPAIFFERLIAIRSGDPDPGSVILMCIEVLTRISGKHALFQMDPWHVSQSLRIPSALFQVFPQLELKAPSPPGTISSGNLKIDHAFSLDLYAACCRLLYTVLKHHKSECERSIALLQDSASVLLYCLETVNPNLVDRQGYLSWDVQQGVKCAYSFRRIYEELRQQKEFFGQHCFKFLSSYIYTYSGYGPLKAGIRREIDEALRPGVYALIDACSPDDLQYLHTVFGEGPCRNTLAALQHDYKTFFQYTGKV